ncbi:MAG TPA: tryptophan--tRNA ligase [Candidatus Diapherotrites archaeon]|uniref:Tryptophan--tRNA ligase n=1 Tax=Candidatus Iainarchaeum sp. TaxID=3101447 RepID=A0A7J4IVI1_9ARCH|nr:tryptophan--tRNA ligase [Candidatus Diapherotrites archaeon]
MEKLDPWGSFAVNDYGHVFREFGLAQFPVQWNSVMDNHLFERGVIIAHRDFERVLKRIESKKPFVNITGIASSGPYHLGHKADIDLFRLFKKKGARNYFAVSDLDAFLSRPDEKIPNLATAKKWAVHNVADLLALGLDEADIYVQSRKENRYYEFAFELSKKITKNTFEAVYGHVDLGKVGANFLQYADIMHPQLTEFEGSMPSVTGIGLDQDPHARLCRDIAKRLPYKMEVPSFLYFRHQSGLQPGAKMSSSHPETAIFLNDPPKDIEKKIRRAFSGGQPTVEEHRAKGGNLEIDLVFEMLKFHYPDTKELERIGQEFAGGKMLASELKQFAIDFFVPLLKEHQQRAKESMKKAEKIVYG